MFTLILNYIAAVDVSIRVKLKPNTPTVFIYEFL